MRHLLICCFRWSDFYDGESELSHYEVCLGKESGECDENDYKVVGLNTTYTFENLTLHHKDVYQVTVRVINTAGLSTQETSNPALIDLTPPRLSEYKGGNSSNSKGICNASLELCNENTASGKLLHSLLKNLSYEKI